MNASIRGGFGRPQRPNGERAIEETPAADPPAVPRRDLAIALSLANLCFFTVWAELLPGSPQHYFLKAPPPPVAFAAVAANVTAFAAVLLLGARVIRHSRSAWLHSLGRAAFLATVAFAANSIRLKLPGLGIAGLSTWVGHRGLAVLAAAAVIGTLLAVLRWPTAATRVVATVVLVCAPFLFVTFGRAAWALIDNRAALANFRERPLVPPAANAAAPAHRVLWMIFDELDQRLVFTERPADVRLPELDRFRAEALFATQAYPPSGKTLVSLPALLSGQLIANAWPAGASDLGLMLDGGQHAERWSTDASVFAAARKAGWSSALVGWSHPYCRLLSGLTHCSWEEGKSASATTFREQLARQIARVVQTIPGAQRLGLMRAVAHLEPASGTARRHQFAVNRYLHTMAAAQDALTDPRLDLIFVHWPVPHTPGIYDRFSGELTNGRRSSDLNGRRSNYLDNLVLADRAFGEVRRALERSGNWTGTTIIVSSDHPYRTSMWARKFRKTDEERLVIAGKVDYRVPFLLKLAGDNRALTYDTEFNTLVTSDLVLALLAGQIHDSNDAARWLDTHHTLGQSPYMKQFE